jgi:tetratricopeptide (TPR) repeat protein
LHALFLAVISTLVILTIRQSSTYADAESVYLDTLAKNSNAWMPHNNLGLLLVERDPERAEFHFRQSLRIKLEYHKAGLNLVTSLRQQGRIEEAATQLERTIDAMSRDAVQAPDEPKVLAQEHLRLAQLYVELGRQNEAELSFGRALALSPHNATAHMQLAHLYVIQNRVDDAAVHFEAALQEDPDEWYALRSLGIIHFRRGDCAAAIAYLNRALRAADSLNAYVQIAPELIRILTTCPDPTLRDVGEAIRVAEHLCELTRRNEPAALDILASVYAEAGRFEDAIRTGEEAISVAKFHNQKEIIPDMTRRVNRYRNGQRARD